MIKAGWKIENIWVSRFWSYSDAIYLLPFSPLPRSISLNPPIIHSNSNWGAKVRLTRLPKDRAEAACGDWLLPAFRGPFRDSELLVRAVGGGLLGLEPSERESCEANAPDVWDASYSFDEDGFVFFGESNSAGSDSILQCDSADIAEYQRGEVGVAAERVRDWPVVFHGQGRCLAGGVPFFWEGLYEVSACEGYEEVFAISE